MLYTAARRLKRSNLCHMAATGTRPRQGWSWSGKDWGQPGAAASERLHQKGGDSGGRQEGGDGGGGGGGGGQ